MILLDFNGVVLGQLLTVANSKEMNENTIRHVVLNTLGMYNSKYRDDYGKLIICCDYNSWRKEYYEYYKAKRKGARDSSKFDFDEIFKSLNIILKEIQENIPSWIVLRVYNAEADDIIGCLTEWSQTNELLDENDGLLVFSSDNQSKQPIMIVSGDKDFIQLQRYANVKQYSPIVKKQIKLIDKKISPDDYLNTHILQGDAGDGVPNVLSDDDVFVTEGKRQKPLTKVKIAEYLNMLNNNSFREKAPDAVIRNYDRNKKMIDLLEIPQEIKDKIITQYLEYSEGQAKTINNIQSYFVSKSCARLLSDSQNFKRYYL